MATLRTRLCDVLEIEHPIMQAGMGNGTNPQLVSVVSNAGGFGVLGGLSRLSDEQIRAELRETKRLTKKPFGIDFVFPGRAPTSKEAMPKIEKVPTPILQLRKELRDMGYDVPDEPKGEGEAMTLDVAVAKLRVAMDEKPSALCMGLGAPEFLIKEAKERGIKIIGLIGRVRHAQRFEQFGADVIVATGNEAGGHAGTLPLFTLLPQVADAVKVPVAAAGGIVDGRQLAAVLDLGGTGVWVGTRFLATPESSIIPEYKQRILDAGETTAIWSKAYDGLSHRHLMNRYMEAWKDHDNEIMPFPLQAIASKSIFEVGEEHNLFEYMWVSAGLGSAMIKELKPAADIVRDMVEEAIQVLNRRPTVKVLA